jgi:hypothetical protein
MQAVLSAMEQTFRAFPRYKKFWARRNIYISKAAITRFRMRFRKGQNEAGECVNIGFGHGYAVGPDVWRCTCRRNAVSPPGKPKR